MPIVESPASKSNGKSKAADSAASSPRISPTTSEPAPMADRPPRLRSIPIVDAASAARSHAEDMRWARSPAVKAAIRAVLAKDADRDALMGYLKSIDMTPAKAFEIIRAHQSLKVRRAGSV